jgi:hypothetical protein
LAGTHTFAVPATDPSAHEFIGWNIGTATLNITVSPSSSAQNYTAYYEGVYEPNPILPPDNETSPPSYNVTINAYCLTERLDPHVSITMDGASTGFTTPHTFTSLVGTHTFAVPAQDSTGHSFMKWSTGAATLTITVSPHWPPATYTAYYEGVYRLIISPPPWKPPWYDGGTTDPPPGTNTHLPNAPVIVTAIPSTGYVFIDWILNGVELQLDSPKIDFGTLLVEGEFLSQEPQWMIPQFELQPEFSPSRMPGDVNGDGKVDILDALLLAGAFLSRPGSPRWNPAADLNGDGVVDILDAILLARHFGQHYP